MTPESSTRSSRWPLVWLVLAALGIAALGARLISSERGNVERERRAALEAEAARAAQRISDFVATTLADARSGRLESVVRKRGDHFELPSDPVAASALTIVRGRDAEGEFLLEDAAIREREGDVDRALGALAVAMDEARDPAVRAVAGVRRAALLRARGDEENARAAARAALAAMDDEARSTSREALMLRHLEDANDSATIDALLRWLHGPDDAIARSMLESTDAGRAALARREESFRARDRFEAARIDPDRGGAIAALSGSRLLIAARDEGDVTLGFEVDFPAAETAHRVVRAGDPLDREQDRLIARAPIGALLPGVAVEASCARAELATAFARRAAWIVALFLAVVAAITGAVAAWSRAARRERDHARARSDFVARVGHDLRTPLSLIRMYAETIALGKVEDRAKTLEFAGIVTRESERLSRLVGTVLDFARTSSGVEARRMIELCAWTNEGIASMRPLLDRAGFEVHVEPGDSPLEVVADADALRGALGNLIENALTHAESGKAITIRCFQAGDRAVIEVEDRGPGVPDEEIPHLFERFVRGRGAVGKGTGLGLALVREVAIAHGGNATARNRDGGGLCCRIELPRNVEVGHFEAGNGAAT